MIRILFLIQLLSVFGLSLKGQVASLDSDFELLISQLSKEYNVNFAYPSELETAPDIHVDQEIDGMSLEEILDLVFSSDKLSYRVVRDNKILIRRVDEDYSSSVPLVDFSGKILDDFSGTALPYASVYLKDESKGTMSDDEGKFILKIKADKSQTLVISYLGYEKIEVPISRLQGDHQFKMKFQDQLIDEVTIVVEPSLFKGGLANSNITMDGNRMLKIAASEIYGTDLIRSLQMLPGVKSDNDKSGEIQLRGSSADETLVVLDGIPLYKMDHYYGIFNAINPYYARSVKLYKNNVPLEYESRSGGMVELNSKKEVEGFHGNFEADFLKFTGYVEIPVSKAIDITLGSRVNHTDPFNSPLVSQADVIDLNNALVNNENFQRERLLNTRPQFTFSDFNAKVDIDISDKLNLTTSIIKSRDDYERKYEFQYHLKFNGVDVINQESFLNTEAWDNEGYNISLSYKLKENGYLKLSNYMSNYRNEYNLGLGIVYKTRFGVREGKSYSNININDIQSQGLQLEYEEEDNWHFGINFQERTNAILFQENDTKLIAGEQKSMDASAFIKKYLNLTPSTQITLGARITNPELIDKSNFAPFAEIIHKIDDAAYLKASYARLYQNFRELTFESRFGHYQQYFVVANNNPYPQGKANNFMLGGGFSKNNWRLDAELFYKDQTGTIGFLPKKPGFNEDDVLPNIQGLYQLYVGSTKSKGIDVLMGYDSDKLYSQLGYTLSKSEDQFHNIFRGKAFPSQSDRRHQLKFLNALTVNDFTFSVATVYNSGKPYTSVDLLTANIDRDQIDIDQAIQNLPAYIRLDLATRYDFNYKNVNYYAKASVYNLTNRKNVKYIQQTFAIPLATNNDLENIVTGSESTLVERLFNISVGVNF